MRKRQIKALFLQLAMAVMCVVSCGLPAWGEGETDILFHAGFDGTVAAKGATGVLEPQRTSGEVRFEDGVRGKALVAGDAGCFLRYATKGNVIPESGSIEMWVKPVDWTPAENKGFHIFFVSHAETGWLQLYRHVSASARLQMLVGKGDATPYVDYWSAGGKLDDIFAEGRWMHLAATWDRARVVLYANGEVVSSVKGKGAPAALEDTFLVGDFSWGKPRDRCKTLIDEFRVYRRPLSRSEVKRVYRSYAREEQEGIARHYLTAVKTPKPPKIDGLMTDTEWTEPEWGLAAAVTGFIDLRTSKFATRQARAYLTYDDERLYFAVASDILPGAQPVANITQRDGSVWGDDAIEFFIAPAARADAGAPGEAGEGKPLYFQVIGNSAGVLYDDRSHDKTWNGAWDYRARVFGEQWTAEGSIRWSDLGIAPPKDGEVWRVNFARDWQNPQAWTVWGHMVSFRDVSKFADLLFRDRGTVARVEDLGAFTSGNLAFDVGLVNIGGTESDKIVGVLSIGAHEVATETVLSPSGKGRLTFRTALADATDQTMTLRVVSETSGDTLWKGVFPFERTEAVVAELSPVPSEGVIEVKIDIAGLAERPRTPAATVTFTDKKEPQKSVAFRCEPFDRKGRSFTRAPMNKVPAGSYDVEVNVFDGENAVAKATSSFERRDEPWRGNTIGITDKILPGWTPIEVSGKALGCWGRQVSFDGTLFPSKIVTRGAEILGSPIRLHATSGAETLEWRDVSFEITKQTPARVDFVTSASSENLRVENSAYLEYDGMFFFKMKLIPTGSKTTLDALSLVIPLLDERGIFWHYPGGFPDNGGRIARSPGVVWQRPFMAFMWVGDYDRGLTWFAEDCTRWNISDATKTLELVRTNGALEWRIHFADAPMEIDAPITIAFGLQPTPVKPLPAGWRLLGMAGNLGQSPRIVWTNPQTTLHFGYPEAPDCAYIRRTTADWHRRGVRVIPYMHAVCLGEMSPEWQSYGRDWARPGWQDSKSADVVRFRGALMGVCPSVKAFRDWMAWKNAKHLEATGYDGLYFDHGWPSSCSHPNHGHAPGAVPLLGYREHYRRLYTLCKERNPDSLIAAHVSGGLCTMFLSWADITIPGEELTKAVIEARQAEATKNTQDIFGIVDFDYYHAWCSGRQFGPAPVFLTPNHVFPLHRNCYMLLTDSVGSWGGDGALIQVYHDLGMGADDVAFLPFWDNAETIQADFTGASADVGEGETPGVLASAYRRAGKFVMFAVCNMTKSRRRVTVHFDPDALGFDLSECALSDGYSRHPLFAAGNPFEVDLNGHTYRLILLEKLTGGETTQPLPVPMPPADHPANRWATGTATLVAGTERLRGQGKELAPVGDAVRDSDAPVPQESRLAQTFTLTKTTKIQSIKLERREPKVVRRGLPCDLRVFKADADGGPCEELADPKAQAWLWSIPGETNVFEFFFKESFVLPPGRYIFVLSKPPAVPEERHHFLFALWEEERVPGETALVWENNSPEWRELDGVLAFAVFGYER